MNIDVSNKKYAVHIVPCTKSTLYIYNLVLVRIRIVSFYTEKKLSSRLRVFMGHRRLKGGYQGTIDCLWRNTHTTGAKFTFFRREGTRTPRAHHNTSLDCERTPKVKKVESTVDSCVLDLVRNQASKQKQPNPEGPATNQGARITG